MSFKDMKPQTKQIMIIAGAVVVVSLIIAAAVTGSMETLLGLLGGIGK